MVCVGNPFKGAAGRPFDAVVGRPLDAVVGRPFDAIVGRPFKAALYAEQLPTELPSTKFKSGQNVVPYFDGWIRNADGTFDLVFGYFNRNWDEGLVIPAGPDNIVEPGGPDRGQPTYFLPRRQGWVFRVRVPRDFGKQVLTWTIKANGKTEKAYGELLPVEEITERIVMTRGNPAGHIILRGGHDRTNFDPAGVEEAAAELARAGLPARLMVDCSHANSGKQHERQHVAWSSVIEQRASGNRALMGAMLESNLFEGRQDLVKGTPLRYGVSITDACIGWEETERLLRDAWRRFEPTEHSTGRRPRSGLGSPG